MQSPSKIKSHTKLFLRMADTQGVDVDEQVMRGNLDPEVVPQAELMDAAMRWANMICECSPASIRCSKEVVMEGLNTANFEEAFSKRYDGISNMLKGPDFIEGPLAFAQKRKPNWSGE